MKKQTNYGIGYTFLEEVKKGHDDLSKFGEAFELQRNVLEQTDSYCYDRFIEKSSFSTGNVGSSFDSLKERYVWCTNHYLGLNRHPEVIKATSKALEIYGTGSGTSAMSGGRCRLHKEIEDFLTSFLNKEDAVLFPTGYTTNLGLLSTIVQKNDIVISDAENHASIIDGIKLSGKPKLLFKHNDLEDLESKLINTKGKYNNTFVIIESAYSMSGDLAPLVEIVKLKKKYNFIIVLDEAHTFGFYGENGKGLASELGVLDDIDFITGTFSKSCASIGGFCVFNSKLRTFITCRASPYIFQATFPPMAAATILTSMKLFANNDEFATSLHQKNEYMRSRLIELGFDLGESQSPIIPIFITDIDVLTKFESEMYQRGVFAVSIVYPAVKPHEGRIRLILNNSHTYEEIDATIVILHELAIKYGINE